jgi:hypothetical protein
MKNGKKELVKMRKTNKNENIGQGNWRSIDEDPNRFFPKRFKRIVMMVVSTDRNRPPDRNTPEFLCCFAGNFSWMN